MTSREYTMEIELPDDVRTFFEGIAGQARIIGLDTDGTAVTVEFDHIGDDYDLANRAREIAEEASRYVGEAFTYQRPRPKS